MAESQAQLHIDIYPSIDNPTTQTLWLFRDSSTAHYTSTIRSEGNYHARDSWKLPTVFFSRDFYTANQPTNQLVSLSPLLSSTNNPRDIESVKQASDTPITIRNWLVSNSTNAPTVTTGSGSKTIGSIFMNDAADDEIGIRHTGVVICGIPTSKGPTFLALASWTNPSATFSSPVFPARLAILIFLAVDGLKSN